MTLEAASKAVVYAAALLDVGAVVAFWIVLRSRQTAIREARVIAVRRLRLVGIAASAVAIAALVLRAWAHTLASFGWPDAWSLDALTIIAIKSEWGQAWQRQMLASATAGVGFLIARNPAGWAVAAATSAALAASLPLTGHAAGEIEKMVLHVTHILAAGAWLGTLVSLAVLRRWLSRETQSAIFRRFSALALAGAALLAGSGLVATYLYLGAVADLWTTEYGRVLLVKLALFSGVVGCGCVNWRRTQSTTAAPGSALVFELALAAAVVAVTGWLTETAHP
jgi:putative copper export protein